MAIGKRLLIVLLGACLGALAVIIWLADAKVAPPERLELDPLKRGFARPRGLPFPGNEVPAPAMIALGERLFHDPRLSSNGSVSCASCHIPALGLADGVAISTAGITGKPLRRHTPSLWNLAWAPLLFWDGRAESLEDQARFPIGHPDEMASSPDDAAGRLAREPAYVPAFAAAFPGTAAITGEMVLKAIAAFERTLVSPPTRFDRWLAGDSNALSEEQRLGYALFTGKAQCVNCHSGFAFTDHSFHDIGLPGTDRGRGAIIGMSKVDYAFKTPALRELAWTAPYMHNGSKATLEDVVRHYESGGIRRASRSPDMPRPFTLSDDERAALVAFLGSLSSDTPPKPSTEPWVRQGRPSLVVTSVTGRVVTQRNTSFAPGAIRVARGQSITILNDDTRTHNIRIRHPLLDFNSGAQEPGESVVLKLDANGLFEAHCGIHPTMRLRIEVE